MVADESDDNHSGEESDGADFKRKRIKDVEDTVRLDEERRRSKTTADEPRIARDPKAVKCNKKKNAKPKPTPQQREAARKRRKEADRAEVSRKAAELAKESKKLKTQQERSRGLCHLCKKPGHKAIQCTNPICGKCGEPGHRAEHCPEAVCEGCQAHEMEDFKGHLYHVCPYKDINQFCTFCKHTGHEADNCRKPGCKKAARAAAKSAAKPAGPEYDPHRPGAGFVQPEGSQMGLEDFSLDGDVVSHETFEQQCEAEHQRVLLIESRKLKLAHVRESAKKEAAEKFETEKDNPKPRKVKGTPSFGTTAKKIDWDDDDRSEAGDKKSDAKGSSSTSMRSLAVHQASKRAERALKSPLPSVGYRLRADHEQGHNKGRPASVWDIPRSVSSKGKERHHEGDEWGDEEEWHEDDDEEFCSWCGESGHMWEDCPEKDAASGADSTDSSVPLRDWDDRRVQEGWLQGCAIDRAIRSR